LTALNSHGNITAGSDKFMTEISSRKPIKKPSQIGRSPQTDYKVQVTLWIEKDGELYLGGGRIMLLENINEYGSISAAARAMELGYRNAWLWIDSMNQLAPSPLVIKGKGGAGGGYAYLTEEGHKALKDYKELRDKMETALKPLDIGSLST
jgi:molybdate transport system regulatory protein